MKSHRGQKDVHKRLLKLDGRKDLIRTPLWLVDKMIDMLELEVYDNVLDPCCGDNRMLKRISDRNFILGNMIGFDIKMKPSINFLAEPGDKSFHKIIMNPPFSKLGAYKFIKHALDHFLKPGGRIISIIPNYILDNAEGRKPWLKNHVNRLAFIPKSTFAQPGIKTAEILHLSVIDVRHEPSGAFLFLDKPTGQIELPQG